MAYKITLQPSCHTFLVEQHETLLEAALRSGLPLRYHCNNGSCGECKARVLSGSLGDCRFYDYVFSEAEKLQNYTLLCSASAGSDMEIEAVEAAGAQDVPAQELSAKISKIERVSDDVILLNLRTPRSQTLWFLAGQSLSMQIDGLPAKNFSIASCPCNGMQLQLHVHKDESDPVASYCFNDLRNSQFVTLRGPWGNFILDEESNRPIVFIAGEAGFAAIKGIIEHVIALELTQPIYLFWVAIHKDGHYLKNYCRAWSDALDNFRFYSLVIDNIASEQAISGKTGEAVDGLTGTQQILTSNILSKLPDIGSMDVYISGTQETTDFLVPVLIQNGLPAAQLFINDQDQKVVY